MRKIYRIEVDIQEAEKLRDICNSLNTSVTYRMSTAGSAGHFHIYKIELSKYELLYIRLSLKTGTFSEWESQQEQSDSSIQMV